MSTGVITEYLVELNERDSLAALQAAHSQKSILVFIVNNYPNPLKTTIDNFLDKRAILAKDLKDLQLPTDKEVSIKFIVGTDVFFIKTFLKSHLNRYYFSMSSKVIQLKRRKEHRCLIPKKWNQSAFIISNIPKRDHIKCRVVDISIYGIRLEIDKAEYEPIYQRNDIVKIKFQIYKRAEVAPTAIVRFISNKPNLPSIVGLVFANMTALQKARVADIIEDVSLHNSVEKN